MQKRSLEISCYVCGAGAFGVFFRWLQDQMAFNEAGLAEKSVFNYLVPLLILAGALLFNRFIEQAKAEKLYIPTDFCQALRNEGRLFTIARWACGLLMVLGGIALIAGCETDKEAKMMFALAGLAIASGLSYPLLLGSANDKYGKLRHPTLACMGAVLPVLLFALWLVLCYKQNALNSVVWLGVMMCLMSLADERYIGMHIIMLGAAAQLLLYTWLLIVNMQKKQPKEKKERPPEDGFERLR